MENQSCYNQIQLVNALVQPPLISLQKDFIVTKTHINHPDFNFVNGYRLFENHHYYIHLKLLNIRKIIVNIL